MVKVKSILKKKTRKTFNYIIGHAIIGGLIGLVLFTTTYYLILTKRTLLNGGYFSSPFLTTLSELNWYFIGTSFLLIGIGVGGIVGNIRNKRRNK